MKKSIKWMLEGPAWIRYRVLVDLVGAPESDERVIQAKKEMTADPLIESLFLDVMAWENTLLKRHNDADHPIHKLAFLAELGFTRDDARINQAAKIIMSHPDVQGPFFSLSNYPTHFGGSGKDEWLWALCDAPILSSSLLKFGYGDHPVVNRSLEHLKSLVRENGWPCAACEKLGSFRGPGKKSDPCPYANLIMLKALATARDTSSEAVRSGVSALLGLWENSRDERPYLFKMGTDFRKLKVPFIWYDILHVADVLSKFPYIFKDNRFLGMLEMIRSKADENGRYTSESIWTKWKSWEFCQRKEPSRWVTLCVLIIFKRTGV